jgi:hypothetical protein
MRLLAASLIAPLTLWLVPATAALAQEDQRHVNPVNRGLERVRPDDHQAVLGPDFCRNVALGLVTPFATKFADLFAEGAAGAQGNRPPGAGNYRCRQ